MAFERGFKVITIDYIILPADVVLQSYVCSPQNPHKVNRRECTHACMHLCMYAQSQMYWDKNVRVMEIKYLNKSHKTQAEIKQPVKEFGNQL